MQENRNQETGKRAMVGDGKRETKKRETRKRETGTSSAMVGPWVGHLRPWSDQGRTMVGRGRPWSASRAAMAGQQRPPQAIANHEQPMPVMAGRDWPWLAKGGHGKPLAKSGHCIWLVESYLADLRKRPDLGLKRPNPGLGRKKPKKYTKKRPKIRKKPAKTYKKR